MADIRIRSNLLLGVVLQEPNPNPDKPGSALNLRSFKLRPGLNTVDADAYHAWAGADPKPELLTNGSVFEAKDEGDADADPGAGFGFEPALKAASTDGASAGSTITGLGPVSSADMKPTSDAPADDSPRSQPRNPNAPPSPAAGPAPVLQPAASPATPAPAAKPAPAAIPAK